MAALGVLLPRHGDDNMGADMDMMGPMGGGGMSMGGLSPAGVDFSNETQAFDFLAEILNDDELKVIGNAHARYFWYGIAAVVGLACLVNLARIVTLRMR